jgi:Flp pilus assembly protein TadG
VGIRDRRVRASQDGAVAVEMAIIAPVLVLLLVGIIEFGFAFNAQLSLTQAVREGVRVGAIGDDLTEGAMVARMNEAYIGLQGGSLSGSGTPCTAGDMDASAELTGSLAYTTPIGSFGPFNLQARAVMRCGG